MDLPLFQIRNLICSYNQNEGKSLSVEKLDIPSGKLIFLLGASGSGKSTFLETLGLMNNTVASGEVLFYPEADTPPLDFKELWHSDKGDKITSIRKKYFSFIFQNTNLMENFTAYENVCLSGMIKEELTQEKILPRAKSLMNIVKLPESEVSLSTLASNLSGGQRQRLSFVRALNTDSSILFCDEPTGNLDEVNANELFEVIKNYVQDGKSAIVVSHDIDLAIKHADMIIVLSKDHSKSYGEVLKENIYLKSQWENNTELENKHFVIKIRSLFVIGNDQVLLKKHEESLVNTSFTYRKLFYKKEGSILAGKGKANLFVLAVIMFFTFLALGFANGSLDYLNKQMNSAFVGWVSIPIPYGTTDDRIKELLTLVKRSENRTRFGYQNISPYIKNPITVGDFKSKKPFNLSGRTVELKEDLKLLNEFVLEKKNYVRGDKEGFRSDQDISIIVTERLLKDLHYPENADFVLWENTIKDTLLPKGKQTNKVYIPLPIRTVVKSLPGKFDFIYTIHFYNCIRNDKGEVFSTIADTKYLYGFVKSGEKSARKEIKAAIQAFSSNFQWPNEIPDSLIAHIHPNVDVEADTPAINPGFKIEIDFYPNLQNHFLMDSFWNKLVRSDKMKLYKDNMVRTLDFNLAHPANEFPTYDQISVYFENLDNVRNFATFIYNQNSQLDKNRSQMEIDETKIREKENFNFLSKVTRIISVLLIMFSIVAISLFIFNLLKMHLMKVKMNLGTFKAIGMKDKETKSIYFNIILSFVLLSSVIALLLATAIGKTLDLYMVKAFKVEEGVKYFKIFDWITLVAFMVIILTSVLVSWFTINKIISKSPGDLIYNR